MEKIKKKVNPNPLPNSERSKKRKARGFKSLEQSSRKHRRAARRLGTSRPANATHPGGALNYNR